MTQTRTGRHQKAQELWQEGKVYQLVGGACPSCVAAGAKRRGTTHVVTNGAGKAYAVDGDACTCPDYEYRRVACKHIQTVEIAQARELRR